MEFQLPDVDYPAVSISFELTAEANRALSEAAIRSGRTKKQEAKIRLHDHLAKYICISEVFRSEKRVEGV